MTLLINPDRFKADFDALAQIGATGDGGVNRPALGEAHLEAHVGRVRAEGGPAGADRAPGRPHPEAGGAGGQLELRVECLPLRRTR